MFSSGKAMKTGILSGILGPNFEAIQLVLPEPFGVRLI